LCTAVTLTTGADTWLDAANPNTTHGADAKLVADGSPGNSILLKWDLSAIPAGSPINSATMSFHMQDPNDQSGSAFQFYGLRHDWSDANASWDNYDAGTTWGTPGARNTTNDRYATILATTPAGGTPPSWISTTLNGDGIARLQRWIDGVDPDYGFAIQDYADTMGDGFRLDSC